MTKQVVEGHRKDKMKHVNLSDVIVNDRFRQDYGDLEELVASIKEKGIIQPLSVDSNMVLLAGGRRYKAATIAELPTIPVVIRTHVDEIDSLEIELIENTFRKDFTWAEEAQLVAKINDLYTKKYGMQWSGRKTAELLDASKSQVARNLQLAKAMVIIPELVECKTADDAMKKLKKLEEDVLMNALRTRQKETMAVDHADPAVVTTQLERGLKTMLKMADNNYIVGDTFEVMRGLKSNGNIQIIECDPPYGIDLNSTKGSKDSVTSNVHSYEEVDSDVYPTFLTQLCNELYRVAGPDCWLIFWYGPTWQSHVLAALKAAGWLVDEIPAIWTKLQGQTLQPELYFARGYEPFFVCRKGKPIMAERGHLNVFSHAGVSGKAKYHPTQRPIPLIREIFNVLGAGRQHVFVPFLGSGATLLTCYELGFTGFGADLNGEYKDKFMLAVEEQTRQQFSEGE